MSRIMNCGFELKADIEYEVIDVLGVPAYTWETGRIQGSSFQIRSNGNGVRGEIGVPFPARDEIYARYAFRITSAGGGTNRNWFYLRDDNKQIVLEMFSPTGLNMSFRLGDGTVIGSSITFAVNTWYLFEVYFKLHSTTGACTVRIDGVDLFTFTGNTNPSSRNNPQYLCVKSLQISTGTTTVQFDDFGVNDTAGGMNNAWLGNGAIIALFPNDNGTFSQLTGNDGNSTNNYQLVNENPNDGDTTYVYGTLPNLKDSYQLDNVTLTASQDVVVVQPFVVAKRVDPSTPSAYASGVIVGTTEDYSPDQLLSMNYTLLKGKIYETNPDTSAAWDESSVNSLEVAIRTG